MSMKVVATDFLDRTFERVLTEEEIHSLYDGSLNFKEIVRDLAKQSMEVKE